MEARACQGEVASRLESAWDVLNILAMSPVDKHLAGGVLALTMVLVGAWGEPRPPKGCTTRQLKGGMCAQERSELKTRGKG